MENNFQFIDVLEEPHQDLKWIVKLNYSILLKLQKHIILLHKHIRGKVTRNDKHE